MSEFTKVVKLMLTDSFRPSKGSSLKSKITVIAILAAAFVIFEVLVISSLVKLAPYFSEIELVPEFLTAIMAIGLGVVTTLGIMPMLNLLYFSKDAEFFLNLPIKQSKVYFAKLFIVYMAQLIAIALVVLPALYAVGITVGLNWPFYLVMIFAVILLPCFPLLLISVICLPIMYLVRFFKNRSTIASVMAILLFLVFFFVYMFVVNSTSALPEEGAELSGILVGPVKKTAKIFASLFAINRFATFTPIEGYGQELSLLFNFFIFTVPALLLFVVTLIISRKAYSRAVASQLENPIRSHSGSIYQPEMSVSKALVQKELKGIVRTPIFVLQCFVGLLMMPIMIIALGVSYLKAPTSETTELTAVIMWLVIVTMIQTIVVSVNIGASTSFSRDGEAFYINKLLPVPYSQLIKTKIAFYNVIYDADIVICFLLWFIFSHFAMWWVGLVLLAYILIYNYGFISLCILLDVSKPKLDWRSYREIVKGSRNSILPMVIGMAVSLALCAASVGLCWLLNSVMSLRLAVVLVLVLLTAGAFAFAFVVRNILASNTNKYFERIEP